MRIQLFSDLHLERDPAFQPLIQPDTDVIVLAGDIGSYQERSRLPDEDFGLARFSPLRENAPQARASCTSPATTNSTASNTTTPTSACNASAIHLGIEWLDRETIVIDGVRFIGSTCGAISTPSPAAKRT
jgi:hypothetical protein